MEKFEHFKVCDNCGQALKFPNSWMTDNPPDNGWITIYPAHSDIKRKDFCPRPECLTAAVNYTKELIEMRVE